MSTVRTIPVAEADEQLSPVYCALEESFGMVPAIFQSMSLRPDLLEPLALFVKRLMIEEHALPRSTKELLAAYVSTLNDCAY
jgi:alkylhydroperoxidase family enzyme